MISPHSFKIAMIFILSSFGISCSSGNPTTQNIQRKPNLSTKVVEPVKLTFKYPYNESGQLVFNSDKEFHQMDCEGYRSFYNLSKENFPCQSDNNIHFELESPILDGSSYSKLYTGYSKEEDVIYYHTEVNFYTLFISEESSISGLGFEGVDTKNVIAASCPTFSIWSYKTREWIISNLNCDVRTITKDSEETHIDFDFSYEKDSEGFRVNSLTSLIHNEELLKVRMTVWTTPYRTADGYTTKEEERTYYIPTSDIRKDMHRAWKNKDL